MVLLIKILHSYILFRFAFELLTILNYKQQKKYDFKSHAKIIFTFFFINELFKSKTWFLTNFWYKLLT